MPTELSLVVPMYNEQEVLGTFFDAVLPIMERIGLSFEIVCVNDGSSDGTLEALRQFRQRDERIKIVDLSRNFGKESALSAGIDHAVGRGVIPMDADLQDPPEVVVDLVAKWQEGYEMVLAVRQDRSSDTAFKRFTANTFYRVIGRMSDVEIPPNAGDFRLMDRKVIDALALLPERSRFMKGMFAWLGFRQAVVYYARCPRAAGESKWKYWKLWNFALEGIVSFTSAPLKVWSYFGFATAALGIVYMFYIIAKTMLFGVDVPGYASLIVVILFFNGLTMIGLGVLGEYLSRIFNEVKQRPVYLVRERMGLEEPQSASEPEN
ncbi:MAG: glycosyltransferase family 2 protein [Okeania sp. SIO3B3]|nr:glycosyltransferase family 2 protein [Okeania sp. SIO3B3]